MFGAQPNKVSLSRNSWWMQRCDSEAFPCAAVYNREKEKQSETPQAREGKERWRRATTQLRFTGQLLLTRTCALAEMEHWAAGITQCRREDILLFFTKQNVVIRHLKGRINTPLSSSWAPVSYQFATLYTCLWEKEKLYNVFLTTVQSCWAHRCMLVLELVFPGNFSVLDWIQTSCPCYLSNLGKGMILLWLSVLLQRNDYCDFTTQFYKLQKRLRKQ